MEDHLIKPTRFSDIDLGDEFFDSLKNDYQEFGDWFVKKSEKDESAYTIKENEKIEAFLYLKPEYGSLSDVEPKFPIKKRLKIGTFKINPHGTRLGERFIKKIVDFAMKNDFEEVYTTIFSKHNYLIKLFEKYGFTAVGSKTTHNGTENVLLKSFKNIKGDVLLDYPLISKANKSYLLAIYPEFHTRLFPDSILNNETYDVLNDISHTNSIHKIYVCFMDLSILKPDDNIIIYRTSDKLGPAEYRSVISSICRVQEVRSKSSFANESDFLNYCERYSIFPINELKSWYSKRSLYIVKMTYNIALEKRITRGDLINNVGVLRDQRWGFIELTNSQFSKILNIATVNESFILD